jgi:hypothetical protein
VKHKRGHTGIFFADKGAYTVLQRDVHTVIVFAKEKKMKKNGNSVGSPRFSL